MTATKKDQRVRGNQDDQQNSGVPSQSSNYGRQNESVKNSDSGRAVQARGSKLSARAMDEEEGKDYEKLHHPHRIVYPKNIVDENLLDDDDDDFEDEIDDQMNTYPY